MRSRAPSETSNTSPMPKRDLIKCFPTGGLVRGQRTAQHVRLRPRKRRRHLEEPPALTYEQQEGGGDYGDADHKCQHIPIVRPLWNLDDANAAAGSRQPMPHRCSSLLSTRPLV